MEPSFIFPLGTFQGNSLFIKREDLLPFSFGGNKARKAELYFRVIEQGGFDFVVTYGSGSSNHCRVIANECARRRLPCLIISPLESEDGSYNQQMVQLLGADVRKGPLNKVSEEIDRILEELKKVGKNPYFIKGGGHGNIGTEAYLQCYKEIQTYEEENEIYFDFIFLASGTGTTQAGLICGQLQAGHERGIIGISVARKNPRGRDIVLESIRSYMGRGVAEEQIQKATVFEDEYTEGYGKKDARVSALIPEVLRRYGIPLDATYTGKAFWGMQQYLEKENIKGKNLLFLHTGGTPLFFDGLRGREE